MGEQVLEMTVVECRGLALKDTKPEELQVGALLVLVVLTVSLFHCVTISPMIVPVQPYFIWKLDFPKDQTGQTPVGKGATHCEPASFRVHGLTTDRLPAAAFKSVHKLDIGPRSKATVRKFKFLKVSVGLTLVFTLGADLC